MLSRGFRGERRWSIELLGILVLLAVPGDLRAGNFFAEVQGLRVELASEPDRPLRNKETSYTLRLMDSTGSPVNQAKVTLAGLMADGMTVIVPLRPTQKSGTYSGRLIFTMEGEWKLRMRVVWTGEPFQLQFTEQVRQ